MKIGSITIVALFLLTILLSSCAEANTAQVPTIESGTLVGSDELYTIFSNRRTEFQNALSIEVREAEFLHGCHEENERIPLSFTFYNHSDSRLIVYAKLIQAYFFMGIDPDPFYNLSSKITDSSGTLIAKSPPKPFLLMDISPNRDDFIEILPKERYSINIDYYFPDIEKGNAVPGEKEYSIYVKYLNNFIVGPSIDENVVYPQYDWNAWMGSVEAPALTVCIKNP